MFKPQERLGDLLRYEMIWVTKQNKKGIVFFFAGLALQQAAATWQTSGNSEQLPAGSQICLLDEVGINDDQQPSGDGFWMLEAFF